MHGIAYGALFALVVVLLILVVTIVIMDVREGRTIRTGVLAGAGVTFPVLLEAMRRSVREWSQTDLVAVLCRRLDAGQLQNVIDKLLR